MERVPSERRWVAPAAEAIGAVAVILVAAWIGSLTGWKGPAGAGGSTLVWPFYLDAWSPKVIWTGRALAPLAGFALAWIPLRRWLAGGSDRSTDGALLIGLVLGAYAVHLGCGIQRHGLVLGFHEVFQRNGLEYWGDIRFVKEGFLARFPEVGGRLSDHGLTHPPGLTLLLAGVSRIGFTGMEDAELFCSIFGALAALPLWGAARRLVGDDAARFAVASYLFASSVTAFSFLSMDAVTMFITTLSLYLFTRALDGERWAAALWGLCFAAASLCTFTALTLSLTWAVLLAVRRSELDRARLATLAFGPVAFLAAYLLLWAVFGYRPFHVYAACYGKLSISLDARRSYGASLLGNPIAFLGGLGIPLAGLAARAVAGAVWRVRRVEERGRVAMLLGACVPIVLCIALGKPRSEVERIFLLFVPPLLIGVAGAARHWYGRGPSWLLRFALPALVAQSILVEVFFETSW